MAVRLSETEQQALGHYLEQALSALSTPEDRDRMRGELLRLTLAAVHDDPDFLEFIRLGID